MVPLSKSPIGNAVNIGMERNPVKPVSMRQASFFFHPIGFDTSISMQGSWLGLKYPVGTCSPHVANPEYTRKTNSYQMKRAFGNCFSGVLQGCFWGISKKSSLRLYFYGKEFSEVLRFILLAEPFFVQLFALLSDGAWCVRHGCPLSRHTYNTVSNLWRYCSMPNSTMKLRNSTASLPAQQGFVYNKNVRYSSHFHPPPICVLKTPSA